MLHTHRVVVVIVIVVFAARPCVRCASATARPACASAGPATALVVAVVEVGAGAAAAGGCAATQLLQAVGSAPRKRCAARRAPHRRELLVVIVAHRRGAAPAAGARGVRRAARRDLASLARPRSSAVHAQHAAARVAPEQPCRGRPRHCDGLLLLRRVAQSACAGSCPRAPRLRLSDGCGCCALRHGAGRGGGPRPRRAVGQLHCGRPVDASALVRLRAPWQSSRPRSRPARHRYYDTRALQKDFGKITDYAPPKKEHPGSIMAGACVSCERRALLALRSALTLARAVSNTGGHGRGGQGGRIIGDVINHGKHAYWVRCRRCRVAEASTRRVAAALRRSRSPRPADAWRACRARATCTTTRAWWLARTR